MTKGTINGKLDRIDDKMDKLTVDVAVTRTHQRTMCKEIKLIKVDIREVRDWKKSLENEIIKKGSNPGKNNKTGKGFGGFIGSILNKLL